MDPCRFVLTGCVRDQCHGDIRQGDRGGFAEPWYPVAMPCRHVIERAPINHITGVDKENNIGTHRSSIVLTRITRKKITTSDLSSVIPAMDDNEICSCQYSTPVVN